jgi:hypothetical protein
MITKKIAKAILLAPNEGTIIDGCIISWESRLIPAHWPSRPVAEKKIDIFVNGDLVETCDLSFLRKYARG